MQTKDYRSTILVMMGFGLATLTGYARELALARQLGVSRVTDIFLVAYALPEFVFIALPIILTPGFIPIFSSVRQLGGESHAWQFAVGLLKYWDCF
jgi:peptidoglycan biosynthesis protein MviN/MurJ (putative lipid II flippase)